MQLFKSFEKKGIKTIEEKHPISVPLSRACTFPAAWAPCSTEPAVSSTVLEH